MSIIVNKKTANKKRPCERPKMENQTLLYRRPIFGNFFLSTFRILGARRKTNLSVAKIINATTRENITSSACDMGDFLSTSYKRIANTATENIGMKPLKMVLPTILVCTKAKCVKNTRAHKTKATTNIRPIFILFPL